jgi:protein involved in polysaccharide export with SLBB domain
MAVPPSLSRQPSIRRSFWAASCCSLLIGQLLAQTPPAVPQPVAPATEPAESAPRPEAPAPQISAAVPADYVLRNSDMISVMVFGEPELSTQDRLAADGTVMLPILGRVSVAGRTANAAAEHIRSVLAADYLVNPQVHVTVLDHTREHFTILGQVASPGAYMLPPGGKLPFMQALGMAGGLTRMASPRNITLSRRVNGTETAVKVDIRRTDGPNSGGNVIVLSGDVIIVGESLF